MLDLVVTSHSVYPKAAQSESGISTERPGKTGVYGEQGYPVSEKIMNLRGLKCPLPALRLRKALSGLKSGDLIVAECTDPLAAIDIPNLLRETGDVLEGKAEADGELTFRVRKK
jgi:tRNA 2-thiouridine synthesizing protein A